MAVTSLEDRRNRTSAPDLPVSWIRPLQFSHATGMSKRQVYDELYSGRLQGVQVGASWFIRASEVSDYFSRNANAPSVA